MANRILVTGGAGFIGTRLVDTPGFGTTLLGSGRADMV